MLSLLHRRYQRNVLKKLNGANIEISYIYNICSVVPNEQKKKNRRGKYKWTGMQKVIAIFYAVVICASSLFSYVYIANAVYAKTRYNDANIVLDNRYRILADDTEKYIHEEINYYRLYIAKQLGELQDLTQGSNQTTKTKVELQTEIIQADKELSDRQAEQETAQVVFNVAKEKYLEPLSSRWRTKDEQEKEKLAYETAKNNLEKAHKAVDAAKQTLEISELDLVNFKPTATTVVHDFLVEMLQANPSIEDYVKDNIQYHGLSTYMKPLNDCVMSLDEQEIDFTEYSKLVSKTSELSVLVEKYIACVKAETDTNKVLAIKIPIYGDDKYEEQITTWEQAWRECFGILEDTVKKLPEYTETTDMNKEDYVGVVNFEILRDFHPEEVIKEIDDLQRKNFSTINHFERAGNLLVSDYPFLAWFSLGLAFFLDTASLLADLFIYYVSRENTVIKD